ncbi:MAG: DNA-directed RNA polymerase subunit K [Candidatus Diapherotrites archaeon]
MNPSNFTKYERARILGARALQLAMNAPLLIKITDEDLEKINYDVLKIAEIELDSGVLPISIKKPFPERKEGKLKREIVPKISDEKKESMEENEEENIEGEGEIMELANPEDEGEASDGGDEGREGYSE